VWRRYLEFLDRLFDLLCRFILSRLIDLDDNPCWIRWRNRPLQHRRRFYVPHLTFFLLVVPLVLLLLLSNWIWLIAARQSPLRELTSNFMMQVLWGTSWFGIYLQVRAAMTVSSEKRLSQEGDDFDQLPILFPAWFWGKLSPVILEMLLVLVPVGLVSSLWGFEYFARTTPSLSSGAPASEGFNMAGLLLLPLKGLAESAMWAVRTLIESGTWIAFTGLLSTGARTVLHVAFVVVSAQVLGIALSLFGYPPLSVLARAIPDFGDGPFFSWLWRQVDQFMLGLLLILPVILYCRWLFRRNCSERDPAGIQKS
jgi:hypothetical protein